MSVLEATLHLLDFILDKSTTFCERSILDNC